MKIKKIILSCFLVLCLSLSVFSFYGCKSTGNGTLTCSSVEGLNNIAVNPNATIQDRDELLKNMTFTFVCDTTSTDITYTWFLDYEKANDAQKAAAQKVYEDAGGKKYIQITEKASNIGGNTLTLDYGEAVRSGLSINNLTLKTTGTRYFTVRLFGVESAPISYTVVGHAFSDTNSDGLCDALCGPTGKQIKCGHKSSNGNVHTTSGTTSGNG